MTNLEYIRTLSAEEIAGEIAQERAGSCEWCVNKVKVAGEYCGAKCFDGITEWLKQEHEPELKPCPFCGGKPIALERSIGTYVQCEDCRAVTDAYDTEAEAIEAWNRRAE